RRSVLRSAGWERKPTWNYRSLRKRLNLGRRQFVRMLTRSPTEKTIAAMLSETLAHWRRRRLVSLLALAVLLVCGARFADANGSDLPPQITVQGFVKPEDGHLEFLIRIPLVLLASFNLPKRGPGYLDLARIDDRLGQAAEATARQIELFADGARLSPARSQARVALLADRSFADYASARAHMQGPTLPVG